MNALELHEASAAHNAYLELHQFDHDTRRRIVAYLMVLLDVRRDETLAEVEALGMAGKAGVVGGRYVREP
ncbi:hypothetical protein ACIOFY_36705 [Streptomyces anulatus]